jgi:hypothetical protein
MLITENKGQQTIAEHVDAVLMKFKEKTVKVKVIIEIEEI